MSGMNFGVQVPHRGPMTDPDCVRAIVTETEKLGYGTLIVSDHIVVPKDISSRYPYSEEGSFPGQAGGECMEQLTLLAYVAALTSKVKLLTSVMVVPHREPLLAAKSLATTDQLSGGRVIVGCGTGWMREEFEAIGAPDFDKRGEVTDDYIRIFKKVWTDDDAAHDSPYSKFSNITFQPKPVQKPHPPIWIGGSADAVIRRAARMGSCWYVGPNDRLEELESQVETYKRALDAEDKPFPDEFPLRREVFCAPTREEDPHGSRHCTTCDAWLELAQHALVKTSIPWDHDQSGCGS